MSRVEVSDEWRDHVDEGMRKLFTERLGPDIAGDARRYCPVDTGRLKESIEHHLEDDTLIVSASGGGEHGEGAYAAYVELGTDPHTIRPSSKKALFWDGAEHPVTQVHHPGTRPEPFLRPALFKHRSDE